MLQALGHVVLLHAYSIKLTARQEAVQLRLRGWTILFTCSCQGQLRCSFIALDSRHMVRHWLQRYVILHEESVQEKRHTSGP